jgi:hypothetical protein
LQPVDFFFFLLKQRRFDLKKKIDPGDPVTRSKLGIRTLNQAAHRAGLKTMHRRKEMVLAMAA